MLTTTLTIHRGDMDVPLGTRSLEPVTDLTAAQWQFMVLRDDLGIGASQMGDGIVSNADGQPIARISYNGRLWTADGTENEILIQEAPQLPAWDHSHPRKIAIHCKHCKTDNVSRDAAAFWNSHLQIWEGGDCIYDNGNCHECDSETLVERWLDTGKPVTPRDLYEGEMWQWEDRPGIGTDLSEWVGQDAHRNGRWKVYRLKDDGSKGRPMRTVFADIHGNYHDERIAV